MPARVICTAFLDSLHGIFLSSLFLFPLHPSLFNPPFLFHPPSSFHPPFIALSLFTLKSTPLSFPAHSHPLLSALFGLSSLPISLVSFSYTTRLHSLHPLPRLCPASHSSLPPPSPLSPLPKHEHIPVGSIAPQDCTLQA